MRRQIGNIRIEIIFWAYSIVVIRRIRIAETAVRFCLGPPIITQKRVTGNRGEEKAVEYLMSKGYSIVERNFNTKFGEIDLVAKNSGGDFVFVEVKSARRASDIMPEENITFHKLRKFARTIEMFILARRVSPDQKWQMDSISVVFDEQNREAEIQHIENINIR